MEGKVKFSAPYIKVIIGACMTQFGMFFGITSLGYFVLPVTEAYGFDRGAFSLVISLISLVSVVTVPFIGKFAQGKIGARKILIVGGIWCSVCYMCFSLCTTLWAFYLVAVLAGLLFFGSYSTCIIVLINTWFVERKGFVMGLVMACTGVATMLFSPFMSTFVAANGFKAGYIVIGAALLVTSLIPAVLIRSKPQDVGLLPLGYKPKTGEAGVEMPGMEYKDALKSKHLYLQFIAKLLILICIGNLSHLPAYYAQKGFDIVQIGFLGTVLGFSIMIAKILIGTINGWTKSVSATVIIINAIFLVAVVIMPWATSYILVVIAAALMGFGNAQTTVLAPLVCSEIFGQKEFGGIWGILAISGTIGATIGPVIWGYIYDLTGSYDFGFYMSTILLVLSCVLTLFSTVSAKKLPYYDQLHPEKAKKNSEIQAT